MISLHAALVLHRVLLHRALLLFLYLHRRGIEELLHRIGRLRDDLVTNLFGLRLSFFLFALLFHFLFHLLLGLLLEILLVCRDEPFLVLLFNIFIELLANGAVQPQQQHPLEVFFHA